MNGASRKPTSCQNRHPEAADDAGIVRKWRVTAFTAEQCGYSHTQMRPGNGQTLPSALPGRC